MNPSTLPQPEVVDAIWMKRTETLGLSYKIMMTDGVSDVDPSKFCLRKDLVSSVVDHYINDYQILRLRYGITERIQLHRVAGLLTAAIMRYRPITLVNGIPKGNEARINEHFAIFTGLNICAERYAWQGKDIGVIFRTQPLLGEWITRTKFLLDTRNYTSEALILAYETLCMFMFPENFMVPESAAKV
jgi:hypothetical protein